MTRGKTKTNFVDMDALSKVICYVGIKKARIATGVGESTIYRWRNKEINANLTGLQAERLEAATDGMFKKSDLMPNLFK